MFGIVPCRIGGHGILRGFAQRCVLFFSFSLNLFLSIVITNSHLIPILRTRHDNTIRKSTNIATTLCYSLILSAQKLKIPTEKLDPSRFLSTPSLARVSTVRQFFEAYGSTTWRKVIQKGKFVAKTYKFWICLGAPCRGKRRTSIGSSDIIFGRWSRANLE